VSGPRGELHLHRSDYRAVGGRGGELDRHRRAGLKHADGLVLALPAGLTRVTANLTPRAKTALDAITKTSGDSITDAINHALRNTALLIRLADSDGAIHVKGPNDTNYVARLF
jgi:hypothetical protein